jgi:hypothetical protein
MKKMMLAFLLTCGFLQAQISVTTNGGQITNNQVFTFHTLDLSAELPFIVTNTDPDNPINMKIRVDQIQNSDGTNLQLCFGGLCFFSINTGVIYPTNFPVTLEPGESTVAGDHFWNSNPGDGTNYPMVFRLTFVRVDDNGAYLNDLLTFTYRYSPDLAVSDFSSLQAAGVTKINTLVSQHIQIETTESGTLDIMDLSGKTVVTRQLEAAAHNVDFSGAANGMYVARFTNGRGQSAQIKIIKQ